jgi:hypothetical protein
MISKKAKEMVNDCISKQQSKMYEFFAEMNRSMEKHFPDEYKEVLEYDEY